MKNRKNLKSPLFLIISKIHRNTIYQLFIVFIFNFKDYYYFHDILSHFTVLLPYY